MTALQQIGWFVDASLSPDCDIVKKTHMR